MTEHSEACRTPVDCTVCGKRKKPIGRSAPLEMAGSLCDMECTGYLALPHPPHLWPNECLSGEETEDP